MSKREGMFTGRVVEETAMIGKNEKTGNEEVILEVKLADGGTGRVFLSFTEKAAKYSIEKLKACGWKGGNSLAGVGDNEVQISIRPEVFEGKEREKWDIYAGPKLQPMAATAKDAFFAKLNKLAGTESGGFEL